MSDYSATKIIPLETKCTLCTQSLCCNYITQKIKTPRSKLDFEHLLWQVSHKNVSLFKDKDEWLLCFNSPCEHLTHEGNCGIYHQRPTICREHSNDYCEYDAPAEEGFEFYFPDYESLLLFCKKRFKRWNVTAP
ncbi:MAG: YkgJ family cysteine cluster protein [Gammaproteobacteria bacterium]|nr:YkgJ family cysteine cluster protein [Gammaproteobacteria bacterium]